MFNAGPFNATLFNGSPGNPVRFSARVACEMQRSSAFFGAVSANIKSTQQHSHAVLISFTKEYTASSRVVLGVGRSVFGFTHTRIELQRKPVRTFATILQVQRVWFGTKLWSLLPEVYREQDNGDLDALLRLIAELFDVHKGAIDAMPQKWSLERCPAEFLPRLAATLGWPWDPKRDTELQRREIGEAVETYRKKGTIPALLRALEAVGWRGSVEETFRDTIRLVRRSTLNQHRLAGTVFNNGVCRLDSETFPLETKSVSGFHAPAGVRTFYFQHTRSTSDAGDELAVSMNRNVARRSKTRVGDFHVLNISPLNQDAKLTRRAVSRHSLTTL